MPGPSVHPGTAATELVPAWGGAVVTPHDTNELIRPSRALIVGTTGTVAVEFVSGMTLTIPEAVVTASPVLPIAVVKVLSTGTTASNIVALF